MQLIESPNSWSCLPCAFAMALGIDFDSIISKLGHDGSEIVFPTMPEPKRRRTFHIQECIAVAWYLGWATTEHEFEPVLTPDGHLMYDIDCRGQEIIESVLPVASGVLIGRGTEHMHATAWDHRDQCIYDPLGVVYRFQNQNVFTPQRFFSLTKIL